MAEDSYYIAQGLSPSLLVFALAFAALSPQTILVALRAGIGGRRAAAIMASVGLAVGPALWTMSPDIAAEDVPPWVFLGSSAGLVVLGALGMIGAAAMRPVVTLPIGILIGAGNAMALMSGKGMAFALSIMGDAPHLGLSYLTTGPLAVLLVGVAYALLFSGPRLASFHARRRRTFDALLLGGLLLVAAGHVLLSSGLIWDDPYATDMRMGAGDDGAS